MNVDDSLPQFDSDDRRALLTFLQGRTGQRLLARIQTSAPQLLAGGDTNDILIRSGERIGFEKVIIELLSLAQPEVDPTVLDAASNYPAPEDDAQWQDGMKLDTPSK